MSDPHEQSLQCMEVWGGNRAVDSSVRLAGLDAWVYSKPHAASDGGGDVYYVSSCATGRITRLLVADVAGHGASVSALAVALRELMRQHVNHHDQVTFVRRMNEAFVLQSQVGSFATAVVTTFFAPTGSLSLCNAGHPPPLMWRGKEKRWSYIEQARGLSVDLSDVPLGIVDLADYQQFEVNLLPDDLVICYTDSLPEARLSNGEYLGMDGLLAIFNTIQPGNERDLISRIVATIEAHCGLPIEGDDITLLLFKPNFATRQIGFSNRFFAPFRIVRGVIGSLVRGSTRLPLPDWTVANAVGAIIPWFERRKRRKMSQAIQL